MIKPASKQQKKFLYIDRGINNCLPALAMAVQGRFQEPDPPNERIKYFIGTQPSQSLIDERNIVFDFLRAVAISDRERMLKFCKESAGASIEYETGAYGFVIKQEHHIFYLRCMENPSDEESDYYIYAYANDIIDRCTSSQKGIPRSSYFEKPKTEQKKPTDWKEIGKIMRETGLSYGTLVARNMLP